ncbi:MAG: WD40/YVTN/BNR-like repeat-containing protein [Chthoniobacterales bacterium]
MRSKTDAKTARAARGKKTKKVHGGKALQRLLAYLAERDPALNNEILADIPAAAAAQPRFQKRKAKRASKPRKTKKSTTPAAKPFATAIAKAATALTEQAATAAIAAPGTISLPASWQSIGPSVIPNGQTYGTNRVDVIGRVGAIAVDPSNPQHLLLGAAGGGIWESTNTGASWAPRSDKMPSLAIGAITFDPATPTTVYAGSGEGNFYSNLGAGVYRSTDGGTTWAVLAAAPFVGVGFFDLVVDRQNPTILYAATTNGFYKSTDSGVTWAQKRAVRCWDISVHPNGGAVELLATFADGLFVSTNAGNTFTAVALPQAATGNYDRLAVDRAVTTPSTTFVFGARGTAAYLWRRSGTVWSKLTPPAGINITQAWYDWYVAVTPNNANQVYLGAIDIFRGTLSGSTWTWKNVSTQGANSIHPDQHCLTFSPNNSNIIYAGCDGGIFRSANNGSSWAALNKGLGITEVTYLASDPTTWKWLMAGTQDNGTIRYTGAATNAWDHIADGDGGDCGVNQINPNIVYHSYYNVSLERSTNKGDTWTNQSPPSMNSLFYPPVEVFGSTVAIAGSALDVTRTGGAPWSTVGLALGGGEIATAMREIDANTILIGTNAGRMLRVNWNGATWTKTILTSPAARYISCIAVDPSNPQRIWVTFSQIGGGTVFRSNNGGSSWTNCTGTLPPIPINSIVVDPADYQRVWVAADVGVYQTLNLGSTWASFSNGLPNAMAADLILHRQDRKLICGTRNRGAWVFSL